MADLPYFQFYPRDFLSDPKVSAMTAVEVGAYIRLLCYAWQEYPKGSLSDKGATLQRLAGLSVEEWEEHKDAILSPFELHDGRYHQKRMVAEARRCEEFYTSRSEGARKTNAKRWGDKSVAKRSLSDQSLSDTSASRSTVANHNQNQIKYLSTREADLLDSENPSASKYPSLQRFSDYCESCYLELRSARAPDGDWSPLFDYFESTGWRLSNHLPIADWKAKTRDAIRRGWHVEKRSPNLVNGRNGHGSQEAKKQAMLAQQPAHVIQTIEDAKSGKLSF